MLPWLPNTGTPLVHCAIPPEKPKPGAPELREDARYNRDAVSIVEKFSRSLQHLVRISYMQVYLQVDLVYF